MCGPPVGGLLYQYLGFEATFYANAGLLVLPTILAFIWIPSDRPNKVKDDAKIIHATDVSLILDHGYLFYL